MQFVEPFLLWGALAVAIPVVIHFWHQKQGKPLPWAATQWLIEKQQQQSRGFRLDNVLLMVVRCLLLILLAILLAQPILHWLTKTPVIQKVHLVQPNAIVANNFRFELTDAIKKGERVVWADKKLDPVTDQLAPAQNSASFSPLNLQTAINQIDAKNTELHLYFTNNQALGDVPAITVPPKFQLHTLIDSTKQPRAYLTVKNNKQLFINRAGQLISGAALDPAQKFQTASMHTGVINTLIDYRNPQERQVVKASLAALTDVYNLDLAIDELPTPNRQYGWVLTDQLPTKLIPQTLYIISGIKQPIANANVIFTNEPLRPQTSERVVNGQLPEWLGEQLLRHYGLETTAKPLSRQELNALFIPSTKRTAESQAGIQNGLLLLFLGLTLLERWLALTKNA